MIAGLQIQLEQVFFVPARTEFFLAFRGFAIPDFFTTTYIPSN
jgi:hypothetical protein